MEASVATAAIHDPGLPMIAPSNGLKDTEASSDLSAIATGEAATDESGLQPKDDENIQEEVSVSGSKGDESPMKMPTEWTEAMHAGLSSFKTVERRLSKCLEALDLKDNVKRLEAAVDIHQRNLLKLRKLDVTNDFDDERSDDDDRNSRSRSRSSSPARSRSVSSSSSTVSSEGGRLHRPRRSSRSISATRRLYKPRRPRREETRKSARLEVPPPPARAINPHLTGNTRWVVYTHTIAKVFYAPWEEVVLGPMKDSPYHAVEIPFNEPSSTDLLQTSAERPTPDQFQHNAPPPPPPFRPPVYEDSMSVTDSANGEVERSTSVPPVVREDVRSYQAPDFLPERIRINSFRLQGLLSNDLGALAPNSFPNPGPLHILRPFKVLWDVRDKIRARIRDFEVARSRSMAQMSEEDCVKELESTNFLDLEIPTRVAEYSTPRPLLTSYIMELRCLDDFNTNILEPEVTRISNGHGTVRYSELWFLFPPGTFVVSKNSKVPQKVWKVVERSGGRWNHGNVRLTPNDAERVGYSPFRVDCFYLEHDGSGFVPIWSHFVIPEFEGAQEKTKLNIVPIELLSGDSDTFDKVAALERGQQFLDYCTKPCHRYYTGRSQHLTPKGTKLAPLGHDPSFPRSASGHAERIESEIIIDFAKALQEVPFWVPPDELFESPEQVALEIGRYVGQEGSVLNDRKWNKAATDAFLAAEERKWRMWNTTGPGPSGDDLLLLPDRVFAFVLRTRKWACLPIGKDSDGKERVQVIKPRPEPWNELELPDGHKDVVQSLIDSHFSGDKTRKMHLDLVRDKGKGVIILLHGVPGVGKTSTAECAAESNGRPLLPITCGDLGLGPHEVESKLQEIFRLAHAWNCVLLLDEADIFLAQRTNTDIQRNALVSVFLRILEYYEGILFLTTNRVGTFDEAFKSRIHMSLYYPPLNSIQTSKIWKTNIRKVQENGIEIDSKAILQYAKRVWEGQQVPERGPVWNGRQIRNAFQSAIALAGFHGDPQGPVRLEEKYFESVNRVSEQFSQYIFKTRHGQTDADWNKMTMTRRDDFSVPTEMTVALPRPAPQFQGHQPVPIPPQPAVMNQQYGQPSYSGYTFPNVQPAQQSPQQQQQPPPPQPPHQGQHHQPPQVPGFPQQQVFQQPILTAPFQGAYSAAGAPQQPNFASQPTNPSPWE